MQRPFGFIIYALSIYTVLLIRTADILKVLGSFAEIVAFCCITFIFFLIVVKLTKRSDKVHRRIAFIVTAIISCILLYRILSSITIPYSKVDDYNKKTDRLECKIISNDFIARNQPENYHDIINAQNMPSEALNYSRMIVKTRIGLICLYGLSENLSIGDSFNALIEFYVPTGSRNPGGFNEYIYLSQQGIYLKGKVHSIDNIKKAGNLSLVKAATACRAKFITTFDEIMPPQEAGITAALIIGDKTGLSDDIKKDIKNSGLSHIAAVSGAAVAFLIMPLKKLLVFIGVPRRLRDLLIFAALIFFGFITLWAPSITRAIIVVIIRMFSLVMDKTLSVISTVSMTVIFISIFDITSVLSPGFWLSIAAVTGIMYLGESLSEWIESKYKLPRYISDSTGLSLAANFAVLPLLFMFEGKFGLIFIIANLFVMPAIQYIVPLGVLTGITAIIVGTGDISKILVLPIRGMADWVLLICKISADIDVFSIRTGKGQFLFACSSIALLVFMLLTHKKSKAISLVITVSLLISGFAGASLTRISEKGLTIIFADVGQGDATIIMLDSGFSILIDGGDSTKGDPAITGILDFYGITTPDIYIATHTHSDHCGGLIDLIEERGGKMLIVPVNSFINEENFEVVSNRFGEADFALNLSEAAKNNNLSVIEASRGYALEIEEVLQLDFLNPDNNGIYDKSELNEKSLVIKITYNGFSAIIAGDSNFESEIEMINENVLSDCDLLRIGHHGSRTSTSHDIINKIKPEIAIISVGFNFYGHPSAETIDRLQNAGSAIYRTDLNGAVIININDSGYYLEPMIDY